MGRAVVLVVFIVACIATTTSASASPADDKTLAQEKFVAGQQLFAAGDYRGAGEAFEEAYRQKPHYSPLWNAGRSWEHAGEHARAANLYARYLREAPTDDRDHGKAMQALRALRPELGKIVVIASGATDLRIDDEMVNAAEVYVSPGEHVVSATVGGESVRRTISVNAAQELRVTLETSSSGVSRAPPRSAASSRDGGGATPSSRVPWSVIAGGAALTVVGAGLTVWSGLDTNAKRTRFDEHVRTGTATQDEIDAGKHAQLRTNVILVVTGLVAVATGAGFLFVNRGSLSSTAWRVSPRLLTAYGMSLGGDLF